MTDRRVASRSPISNADRHGIAADVRFCAFRNVEAVEDAYRQSNERNMNDDAVLSFLMDRIVFPRTS